MTAEGDVLNKLVADQLAKAKRGGCSDEGHKALVGYLESRDAVVTASLLDIRAHVTTSLTDMKSDIKAIRSLAERKGSIFGQVPWARPAKVTGVGSLAAAVVWALAKLYNLVP